MKVTFAFLANLEIHNLVRNLSWEIHQKYHTGLEVCLLPPHISLKQPFEISALSPLERYMTDFARSIKPFAVNLTRLELIETSMDNLQTGILWIDVRETNTLRQLHNRLNKELTMLFGDVSAAYDGSDYHFHMSLAIGGQPIAIYRKIFNEFSVKWQPVQFTVKDLALFTYDESNPIDAGYLTLKTLSIGK